MKEDRQLEEKGKQNLRYDELNYCMFFFKLKLNFVKNTDGLALGNQRTQNCYFVYTDYVNQ